MLMDVMKQTAKSQSQRQPQRSAVPQKTKPRQSHKIGPQRILTGSTTVPPWKWSKSQSDFHPDQVVAFFSALFSLNKSRSCLLFHVNIHHSRNMPVLSFGTECHFLRIVFILETVMSLISYSIPHRLILNLCPIIFTACWGFFCLIFCVIYLETAKRQTCNLLELRFYLCVGWVLPTCLHSTITIAGMLVRYIYC